MQTIVFSKGIADFEIDSSRVTLLTIRTYIVHFYSVSELFYLENLTAEAFFTSVQ